MKRAVIGFVAIAGPTLLAIAFLTVVPAEATVSQGQSSNFNVRRSLTEGDTVVIIAVPRSADRLTFVNDNCGASGRLNIAVSELPPENGKWREVQGNIPFNRKRLFHFSLVGIEAKYVRLSFHIDRVRRS